MSDDGSPSSDADVDASMTGGVQAETGGMASTGGAASTGGDLPGTGGESDPNETMGDASMPDVMDSSMDGDPMDTADTRAFVPDIPVTAEMNAMEAGMEIYAHTILEADGYTYYFAAVRNTGTLTLCAMNMPVTFLDADGVEVAEVNIGKVAAPLYRLNGGKAETPSMCMGPGDTGMIYDQYSLGSADVSRIASATYAVGGINIIDAVPAKSDAEVTVEMSTDSFDRPTLVGDVRNLTGTAFDFVDVYVFAVNAVGRPLLGGDDLLSSGVPAYGSTRYEAVLPIEVPAGASIETFVDP